ncbi:MAG: winged helix-turn-helix domain-containing protein, partial [Myxococcota bacterium]
MTIATTVESRQRSSCAPIRIAAGACDDARLLYAAAELGMSIERLFYRLVKMWSWVTTQETARFPPRMIAVLLGKRRHTERVVEVLCDPSVGLATQVGEHLELDMRDLFGDIDWYGDLRATAVAGGEARAAAASRDESGRFAKGTNRDAILARLGDGPATIAQMMSGLELSAKTVRRHVRKLIAEGLVVEADSTLALTDSDRVGDGALGRETAMDGCPVSTDSGEDAGPASLDNGTDSGEDAGTSAPPAGPAVTSALTLSPAPEGALSSERALTRAREPAGPAGLPVDGADGAAGPPDGSKLPLPLG